MSDRSVEEILGWEPWGARWRDSTGARRWRAATDDCLAWLWEHTCPDCLRVSTECYQVHGPRVDVTCCCLPGGAEWPEITAPTLHAALEAAVRAVAERGEP